MEKEYIFRGRKFTQEEITKIKDHNVGTREGLNHQDSDRGANNFSVIMSIVGTMISGEEF